MNDADEHIMDAIDLAVRQDARANAAEAALARVRAVIDDEIGQDPHRCDHCGWVNGDWVIRRVRDAVDGTDSEEHP